MGAAASLAWAADCLDRREVERAPAAEGPGVAPLDAEYALVTQIEFQGLYSAIVLRRVDA
jgi:hypothetical protein